MEGTRPVFIVGTGRCGTRSMYKMLAGTAGVEIHHEFACTHVQQAAALYCMRQLSRAETVTALADIYGSAVRYSDAPVWIDSSNKASWVIPELAEIFPGARFLALVRDGRKVVSSFFNKLAPEIYDDVSVEIVRQWLQHPREFLRPPPEKKYWWNVPVPGQPFHEAFATFDQFERICYHWRTCNEVIADAFGRLPAASVHLVRLEDLTADESVARQVLEFIGVDWDPSMFEALQTPQNVFFPMDFQLVDEQQAKFDRICASVMSTLGYAGKEAYVVEY